MSQAEQLWEASRGVDRMHGVDWMHGMDRMDCVTRAAGQRQESDKIDGGAGISTASLQKSGKQGGTWTRL